MCVPGRFHSAVFKFIREMEFDRKARYHYVVETTLLRRGKGNYISSKLTHYPSDPKEQDSFARKHSLCHGDVVNFGQYRDVASCICVYSAENDHFSLLPNPDDSGSGYLTIPEEALLNVKDAVSKYQDVIESASSLILHINNKDKFIQDLFHREIPEKFKCKLEYDWGEISRLTITDTDTEKSRDFDPESTTWEEIEGYFEGACLEQSEFRVSVTLEDEKLKLYKEKHGSPDNPHAWRSAQPVLPKTWTLVELGGNAGPDKEGWEWLCQGPTRDEDAAQTAVDKFLEDFI